MTNKASETSVNLLTTIFFFYHRLCQQLTYIIIFFDLTVCPGDLNLSKQYCYVSSNCIIKFRISLPNVMLN